MELLVARLNNESAMETRERAILVNVGSVAQAALRHQRVHIRRQMLLGVKWTMNKERTLGTLKSSKEIEISSAKKPNTSVISVEELKFRSDPFSQKSRLCPNNCRQFEILQQKQQSSPNFRNLSELSRFADERDSAQLDSHQTYEDEQKKSDPWRGAALQSEQDAPHSQSLFLDYILE